MNAEIKDKKWLFGGICLQLGTGYTLAFLVYQAGTFITEKRLGDGFFGGLVAVLGMVGVLIYLIRKADAKIKEK